MNRRSFVLFCTTAFSALAVGGLAKNRLDSASQALQTLWDTKTFDNNEDFLSENATILSRITLGSSFSPEELHWLQSGEEDFRGKIQKEFPPEAVLGHIFTDLGLQHVRLGTRWSTIEQKPGVLDFSYYRSLFETTFEHSGIVCWNPGPIKTFRWPEVYIPEFYTQGKTKLPKSMVITARTEISQHAQEYLESLFDLATGEFGKDLAKIKTIQPENELFNPFGPLKWTVSEDHIKGLLPVITKYFPDSRILFSASGGPHGIHPPDLYKVQDLIDSLRKTSGTFSLGLNYYHRAPNFPGPPLVQTTLDNFSQLQILGNKNIFEDTRKWARRNSVQIEVTEGQAEPWKPEILPGNSLRELQFMILRAASALDLSQDYPALIRLWGIERLALRMLLGGEMLTREHKEMIKLIQALKK